MVKKRSRTSLPWYRSRVTKNSAARIPPPTLQGLNTQRMVSLVSEFFKLFAPAASPPSSGGISPARISAAHSHHRSQWRRLHIVSNSSSALSTPASVFASSALLRGRTRQLAAVFFRAVPQVKVRARPADIWPPFRPCESYHKDELAKYDGIFTRGLRVAV